MSLMDFIAYRRSPDKRLSQFIKNVLGFYPRNLNLYQIAFTHKSMLKGKKKDSKFNLSNERLEYLGDAVLELAVADYLFHTFPLEQEGFLTEMRSRLVSRTSLNKLSQKLGFDEFIQYTHDESNDTSYRSVGGNTFEALMGAIYLDRGFSVAKDVIINRIIREHVDLDQLQETDVNFKSKILEWSQKHRKNLVFKVIEDKMENHHKVYKVQVFINDKGYAEANGFSIKSAEQRAAERTLAMLSE